MAYSSIKRTAIKIKSCKCGCGKPYTISCFGYNFNCLPKIKKDEKVNKHLQYKRKAQQRANTTRLIHLAQKEVGLPKNAKRQTPIPKFSQKMITNLKIYSVLRKDYLKDHPTCEVSGCKKKAIEIHHKKGRGILLNVVDYWMAICRNHHNWIGDNPKEAMELGLTISRLESINSSGSFEKPNNAQQ